MEVHKSGFVNIIGRPNIGKSTLLNALVGERLAIITSKPQTTRHRILALLNTDDAQIVFSDSPGIVADEGYLLHQSLNKAAYSSFEDADVLMLLTDPFDAMDAPEKLLKRLKKLDVPKFLVLNKSDLGKDDMMREVQAFWERNVSWDAVHIISALNQEGIEDLHEDIKEKLPIGPPYYPKDQLSDRPEKFFVSEIIREEILLQYKQEIPYATQVVVEYFQEEPKITRIGANIFVARKTQKPIIIGKNGSSIKQLGIASREKIETFLDKKVYLELYVKIKKDWRNNELELKRFGYK